MKTSKTMTLQAINLLIALIPLLCSCTIPFQVDNKPPVPAEDPFYISGSAQTIITKVENLSSIRSQYPDQDKVTINDVVSEREKAWTRIENEWISLYQYRSVEERENIEITVSENKTGGTRQYVLGIRSKYQSGTLTIIQNAQ